MSLRSSHTIDHFKKHDQLYVPRAHYELHFDEPGNEELSELIEATSDQVLKKLPDSGYYPHIPVEWAHHTIEEVSDFTEDRLRELDQEIQEEVLDDMDAMELEISREVMVGEDGILFSIDPRDELSLLREKIRRILGRHPDPSKLPHVTFAYAKENNNTTEVCRLVDVASLRPAIVSVSGLSRVMQWSTGQHYEWDNESKIFLPFGRQT